MDDTSETDPIESEAAKYDLKYIGMDGNIACFGKNRSIVTDLLYQQTVHLTALLFNQFGVIVFQQQREQWNLYVCIVLLSGFH